LPYVEVATNYINCLRFKVLVCSKNRICSIHRSTCSLWASRKYQKRQS